MPHIGHCGAEPGLVERSGRHRVLRQARAVAVIYGKRAHVREVLEIDLPYPRTHMATRNEHQFTELRTHIYALVRGIADDPIAST